MPELASTATTPMGPTAANTPPAPEALPLLARVTQGALDEDYRHVAESRRRVAGGAAGEGPDTVRRRSSHWVLISVALAFGGLITVAATQASRERGINTESRSTLVGQIRAERANAVDLESQLVSLRADSVRLQRTLDALDATDRELSARVRQLQLVTGAGAASGPGVRVAVDQQPDAQGDQVIQDQDLRLLVDGLWQAGAQAVSINGERLTALTAIRNVGVAIHVNGRPLSPPYEVLAIGDPETLQARFLASARGQQWSALATQLGLGFRVQNVDSLTLPGVVLRPLRAAVSGTGGGGSSSVDEGSAS